MIELTLLVGMVKRKWFWYARCLEFEGLKGKSPTEHGAVESLRAKIKASKQRPVKCTPDDVLLWAHRQTKLLWVKVRLPDSVTVEPTSATIYRHLEKGKNEER